MNQRRLQIAMCFLCCLASVTAQDPYGSGSPGAGGLVPRLSCGQAWLGNTAFGFGISNAEGGAAALLAISTMPANINIGGPTILISPDPADLVLVLPVPLSGSLGTPGAGGAAVPFPLAVPATPALAGFNFYAQALVSSGAASQPATTQGLIVELSLPPKVFVGTSVGGSSDPTYFIDPLTQTLEQQFNSNANNVTDAEFAHGNRRLYVSLGLGNSVAEVNLETTPPTWSTFYAATGSCYGVYFDKQRKILYTLAGQSTAREIVALDAALGSPTYGQVLASTTGIGAINGFVERWEGSPDGTQLAVLTVFNPQLVLVDSDPASPNYMQWTSVGPIPLSGALPIAVTPGFTPGNEQILISVSLGGGPGAIVRFDSGSLSWIDHNPSQFGIQHIGPNSVPPANVPSSPWDLDVARSGTFAVTSGWASGGGLGRVDIDPANPAFWAYTSLASGGLDGAWACSISGDDASIAVGTFGGVPGGPQVFFFDAFSGVSLGSVPIPGASNVYTVKWN